ncbi:MAG: hypothetical protein A3A43_02510 [Candidatus Liptonbacteria bacterium RIFCSPLOWO2_01_FULL_56_20]|uniref:Uncharacterized protein n=1 Tax=Candidatus Liptonbacteria bacterium RIFCSPLOWO2_01_FULL_56_20 TaxID=1798652 RepID=A0A1G2CHF5_9BACT|nr:MAG: hypothetical protein UY96_C0002G0040 [Parcubacteria group bacterium GW2011_GWB1_56_8]OGY98259.1 MAG: hypothetical protein A2681_00325 [Candidatus Liptonbacteria bacterium RIFCSPHIGHO2_01_FULL_56_18b]OGZ00844.1 MAG: hypothetical protein A3A43_02510 [Candidatus Liptonbacteria bacterium RIFCSPLOWO2_01_FULL_56_20]
MRKYLILFFAALPSSGQLYVIASLRNGGGSHVTYQLDYYNNAGTKQLRVGRVREGVANDFASYNVNLHTGAWYHLVLWYDAANLKLYQDTAERASQAFSGNVSETAAGARDARRSFRLACG